VFSVIVPWLSRLASITRRAANPSVAPVVWIVAPTAFTIPGTVRVEATNWFVFARSIVPLLVKGWATVSVAVPVVPIVINEPATVFSTTFMALVPVTTSVPSLVNGPPPATTVDVASVSV